MIRSDYYVYALIRENDTPFYIGMGRGARIDEHEKEADRGENGPRHHVIRKLWRLGIVLVKMKLQEELTRREAHQLEIMLIQLIGRRPNGPLVNLTGGGTGAYDPSPELIKKLRPTWNKFIANAPRFNRERVWTDELRAKVGASVKETMTPEYRALMSKRGRENMTPELRDLISVRTKEGMTPEVRAQLSKSSHERVWTEASRKKSSVASKKHVWTEEDCEKVSVGVLEFWKRRAGSYWITNGIDERFCELNETVPEGWRRGRAPSIKYRGGHRFITDGTTSKKYNALTPLPDGWRYGMARKSCDAVAQ